MSRTLLVLSVTILMLTSIQTSAIVDHQPAVWIESGQQAVRDRFVDPRTVEFRNGYFHQTPDGIPAACGEVSAVNSFGARTGYKHWIYLGVAGTFLETEIADFHGLWRRLCAS